MPDGQTHIRFTRKYLPMLHVLGVAVLWAVVAYTHPNTILDVAPAIATYIGYLFGILFLYRWFDPDLDQLGMTSAEGRAMNDLKVGNRFVREIGGLIGFMWVWWALPYAYFMKFFGGHRGLSHVHLFGTATRFVWIFMPAFALWFYIGTPYQSLFIGLMSGLFVALSCTDSLHIFLDNHPPRRRNGNRKY